MLSRTEFSLLAHPSTSVPVSHVATLNQLPIPVLLGNRQTQAQDNKPHLTGCQQFQILPQYISRFPPDYGIASPLASCSVNKKKKGLCNSVPQNLFGHAGQLLNLFHFSAGPAAAFQVVTTAIVMVCPTLIPPWYIFTGLTHLPRSLIFVYRSFVSLKTKPVLL